VGFTCPVCGYDSLTERPWTEVGGGSYEICPSCGIQFGYTDFAGADLQAREELYERWRREWIENGMRWNKGRSTPPPGWDPVRQLNSIGVNIGP